MKGISFITSSLILLAFHQGCAEENESSGFKFFSSEESIADVYIEPYSYPSEFEGPDILECLQENRFIECEELLLEALPGAKKNEEATIYLYCTLGMVMNFQADLISDPKGKKALLMRSLDYLIKGEALARRDADKYRLQLASLLDNKASIYEHTGHPEKAIRVREELMEFTGVGTGYLKDDLAANSISIIARLRLEAGYDTLAVYSYLDSLKDHENKLFSFYARRELLEMDILKMDFESAKQRLKTMQAEYAGQDSVGVFDLNEFFQRKEHFLRITREYMDKTGKKLHRITY